MSMDIIQQSGFFENADYFDSYDRSTNIKLFYGEFAARTSVRGQRPSSLDSALSIAACMTGIERNADLVIMASYAPLFARNGYTQWTPNLIYFDDAGVYGTPEYYVQKMFASNLGDYTLKSELVQEGVSDDVYQTVSYDEETKEIIIKLVNAGTDEKVTDINIDNSFNVKANTEANVSIITGDALTDMNSMSDPENVSIHSENISVSDSFRYSIPAISAMVIRIPTASADENEDIISDAVVENGTLTKVRLNLPENTSGKLYVAQYNDDNTLYSLKVFDAMPEINVGTQIEKDSVTLMLWDNQNTPIVDKEMVYK